MQIYETDEILRLSVGLVDASDCINYAQTDLFAAKIISSFDTLMG